MTVSVSYSYTRLTSSDPPRPLLRTFLKVGLSNTTPDVLCLVDTGADRNIFPIDFAEQLNLTLDTKKSWSFHGTTGKLQTGYIHRVQMGIYSEEYDRVEFEFATDVVFCEDYSFPIGPLLGQVGFFSEFKTLIDQRQSGFSLQKY